MKPKPSIESANFPDHGKKMQGWRNEVKWDLKTVESVSGISLARLEQLEKGEDRASDDELQKLAPIYEVNPADLLPGDNDLENGTKIQLRSDAPVVWQDGYETRYRRAMTARLPGIRPIERNIHRHFPVEETDLNERNHTPRFLQVLEGELGLRWRDGKDEHHDTFTEGDSIIIPEEVLHGVTSVGEKDARLFSLSFEHDRTLTKSFLAGRAKTSGFSFQYIARESGIPEERLTRLMHTSAWPSPEERKALAKTLAISEGDLMPGVDDTERGIAVTRHEDARVLQQERNNRLQYTYWDRIMTSLYPYIKTVELQLHSHERATTKMNGGHPFHQYTEVTHGEVGTLWEHNGSVQERVFQKGDSWYHPSGQPHGFYSASAEDARILAVTIAQNLKGETLDELRHMTLERIRRLTAGEDYYAK